MSRLPMLFALGTVVAVGLVGTGIAPEQPTPEACAAVADALADWSSYNDEEKEDLIITGHACVTAYPETYGPEAQIDGSGPNETESCFLFDFVTTACVTVGGVGGGLPLESCLPPRPQAHSCYEPHAWIGGESQASSTAGDADTTVTTVGLWPSCGWNEGDPPYCLSPESIGLPFWYVPDPEDPCFHQEGQLVVYEQVTPIQTYVIPNGLVPGEHDAICN